MKMMSRCDTKFAGNEVVFKFLFFIHASRISLAKKHFSSWSLSRLVLLCLLSNAFLCFHCLSNCKNLQKTMIVKEGNGENSEEETGKGLSIVICIRIDHHCSFN